MCVLCLEVGVEGCVGFVQRESAKKKGKKKKKSRGEENKPFYTREKKGPGSWACQSHPPQASERKRRKKSAPNFLFGFYMGDMENVNLTWSLGYCSHPWVEPFLGEKEEMAPCTALAYPS